MQTVEMEMLLAKRGFTCQYVGHTNEHDEVTVSAVLFGMPMTGGLHMEINCGPVQQILTTCKLYRRPTPKKMVL